jgi:hypothetical protein
MVATRHFIGSAPELESATILQDPEPGIKVAGSQISDFGFNRPSCPLGRLPCSLYRRRIVTVFRIG